MKLLSIENLKTYLILIAIVAAAVIWTDYRHQIAENKRQSKNMEMIRKSDSLKYAEAVLTKKELQEYLEYQRKDLKDYFKENNIKIKRIERIITQKLDYRDTIHRTTDLTPILEAIRESKDIRVPVRDSTDCLIVEGFVTFENDTLSLDITDRRFRNRSDVVAYWERNQWKLLGIKTRLFGRKVATVIIKDDCGNTETFVVEKR